MGQARSLVLRLRAQRDAAIAARDTAGDTGANSDTSGANNGTAGANNGTVVTNAMTMATNSTSMASSATTVATNSTPTAKTGTSMATNGTSMANTTTMVTSAMTMATNATSTAAISMATSVTPMVSTTASNVIAMPMVTNAAVVTGAVNVAPNITTMATNGSAMATTNVINGAIMATTSTGTAATTGPPEELPPPAPAANDPGDPSPTELRRRLAAAEAALVAAETRAVEVAQCAELQLQALRRQLEQDKATVQAQVTSLLLELKESQELLESGRREREDVEQRAQVSQSRCRALEAAASGHALQLDQLRLQVQNLETALRVERQRASDEKRKLVQLQAAYHHLFQEYDAHIKASLEGDKRSQELALARARLRAAEEALAAKQERIDRLEAEAEAQRVRLETIPVLQAQADIFKADFAAERAAREQLHAQREALQEALGQLQRRLEAEGAARIRMEEMRNRHSDLRPPATVGGFGGPPPEEEPDLCCPKCQYKAPDMDTLQIHVMDCIK